MFTVQEKYMINNYCKICCIKCMVCVLAGASLLQVVFKASSSGLQKAVEKALSVTT